MLKKLTIFLGIILWPLSLFIANTPNDFAKASIPAICIAISFFLLKKGDSFYLLPILIIPLLEPKLSLVPFLLSVLDFSINFYSTKKIDQKTVVVVFISLLLLVFKWNAFSGQTIFKKDYEGEQKVLQNITLYPTVFFARVFQNKARIPLDKFNFNMFALTDPNNYFFGFHPRQIQLDNQNLYKFPFLAIGAFLLGLFKISKFKYKDYFWKTLFVSLVSLSILSVFDRTDFILWIPLSILFYYGVEEVNKLSSFKKNVFYLLFFVFTIPIFARVLILHFV